ncbi:MAG: TIM barrel protein [Pirellulales bacterium]|nr:TIM barrel protein [Pirellulales bacterium]
MFKNLNISVLGNAGNQSEIIEEALTHGFRAMDLNIVDFANRAKTRGMPYAKRLIESSKIRIGTFTLPLDLESDDDVFKAKLAGLADWAAAAAEVGCSRCVTTVQPAGDRLPYHENFTVHRDRLAEICRVLRPSGVHLGIAFRADAELRREKAFQFIHEMDAILLLAKMVNAPNLGINLDVWDMLVAGGSLETLRAVPVEQIVAVQLADAPEDLPLEKLTEKSRILPSLGGRFDIPAVLVALAEMGYKGPVAVKPHRSALPSSRSDSIVSAIGRSLDAVWKAAGLTPQGVLAAPAASTEA